MKALLCAAGLLLAIPGFAGAHGGHDGKPADLKTAPLSYQVSVVAYCKGVYNLTFKDGSSFQFTEFNLRIKTDSGPNGPLPGTPVQISAGMRGDRAYLVFADPAEFGTLIQKAC